MLIIGAEQNFALEIKMNWDQFVPKEGDATLLAAKFMALWKSGLAQRNVLIVIEGSGDWHKKYKEDDARSVFSRLKAPLDLFYFDGATRRPRGPEGISASH